MSSEKDGTALAELSMQLERLLAAKGWTKYALARRAGLGRTVTSKAFSGREIPTVRTVTWIAKSLGADPEPLLKLRNQAQIELGFTGKSTTASSSISNADIGSQPDPGIRPGTFLVREAQPRGVHLFDRYEYLLFTV